VKWPLVFNPAPCWEVYHTLTMPMLASTETSPWITSVSQSGGYPRGSSQIAPQHTAGLAIGLHPLISLNLTAQLTNQTIRKDASPSLCPGLTQRSFGAVGVSIWVSSMPCSRVIWNQARWLGQACASSHHLSMLQHFCIPRAKEPFYFRFFSLQLDLVTPIHLPRDP